MYTDPIPAIQIGSSSVGKKARPPPLSDCCTQVSSTTFSDASTQAHPTMKDASTQTGSECDNWMRRKLFVDNLTANNKNCKFWNGIQTLSLLNFMFEWVLPRAQKVTLWMGKET